MSHWQTFAGELIVSLQLIVSKPGGWGGDSAATKVEPCFTSKVSNLFLRVFDLDLKEEKSMTGVRTGPATCPGQLKVLK